MFDQNLENTTVDKKYPTGTFTATPMVNARTGLKQKVKKSANRAALSSSVLQSFWSSLLNAEPPSQQTLNRLLTVQPMCQREVS